MTTHAPGAPAPKPGPRHFIQITDEQLALPKREHARGPAPDSASVSKLEWMVLCALVKLSWGGKKPCHATNLEIADAIGLNGGGATRRSQVRIALHGRTYRKGHWDPETGKWKRGGEKVTLPGLCHPSRGFVEVRQTGTSAPRELVLTSRWLQYGRFQVFNGGNGESTEAGPDPDPETAPVIARVPTVPPADDGPNAPVEQPSPVASETAQSVTTAAIAEPAPAPTEQPSPEVLADVLGPHFANRSRQDQASRLVQVLLNRTVLLILLADGRIKTRLGAGADPLSPQETEVLIALKPELVARLKAEAEKSKPPPEADPTPGGEKPAPRVACRADIRERIKRLAVGPADDDSDCRAIAGLLVTDPGLSRNDADPARSWETYLGLARQTKEKVLPEAVFLGAFEEACKSGKVNRGATLVDAVKRLKSALKRPDQEGGWS